MSFGEAVRSVYRNYATFEGRAPRSEYWWFQLFLVLAFLGIYALGIVFFIVSRTSASFVLMALVVVVFAIASFIPSIAVIVRRLHDSDKSGWWFWITLIPYLGSFILLIFMLLPSSVGFNRYGPPHGQQAAGPKVQYYGATRSEALQRFATDAQDASRAGYEPVWQEWRMYPGGEVLEVAYSVRPADPPWRAPTAGPPTAGPPTAAAS